MSDSIGLIGHRMHEYHLYPNTAKNLAPKHAKHSIPVGPISSLWILLDLERFHTTIERRVERLWNMIRKRYASGSTNLYHLL
jgi:hypothetical protein